MPELPEVEITRQGFATAIEGALVRGVRVGKPLRWPLGISGDDLLGLRVGSVVRRGKYLWLPLHAGDAEPGGLLMHLGMSGSIRFSSGLHAGAPGPHDHFDLDTTAGLLRLTDPRRFGAVVWSAGLTEDPAAKLLARLGVEPFDPAFTGARLWAGLRRRRVAVKAALLSGDIVVGAGNIYACEALYRAGIDPRTRSDRLSLARCERLVHAIQATLQQALDMGGSTLRDFRDTHGMSGRFQEQALVYGRVGLPCSQCATPVRRLVQGQRSTFFCPQCQRR